MSPTVATTVNSTSSVVSGRAKRRLRAVGWRARSVVPAIQMFQFWRSAFYPLGTRSALPMTMRSSPGVNSDALAERLCAYRDPGWPPRRVLAERAVRGPGGSTGPATESGAVWYEAAMWVVMSAAEREEFLAGVHVGVLSAAVGKVGRTLAVPVWYSYQPRGLLTVLTGRRSRKAAAIRSAGRFGLCVQDDSPPTGMSASRGRSSARRNWIPLNGSRWPAATWAPRVVTVTSRTTRTPGGRMWRSGCVRSTGSARTRAQGKPRGNASPRRY